MAHDAVTEEDYEGLTGAIARLYDRWFSADPSSTHPGTFDYGTPNYDCWTPEEAAAERAAEGTFGHWLHEALLI